jgi:hypothetical protein
VECRSDKESSASNDDAECKTLHPNDPTHQVCSNTSGANVCVECNTSADCTAKNFPLKPDCDPSTHLCVACLPANEANDCTVANGFPATKPHCLQTTPGNSAGNICAQCNTFTNQCNATISDACSTGGVCVCDSTSSSCVAGSSTPYCLKGSGCVGCRPAMSDCQSPTPECDPTAHVCAPCLADPAAPKTNPDCTSVSAPHCQTETNPANNKCVQCTADTQCKVSGTSGPTDSCDLNADANANKCVCSGSGGTAACGGANSIDCACPTGQVCNPGKGCAACLTNADCSSTSATPACDTATHTCVPCYADGDCTNKKFTSVYNANTPYCLSLTSNNVTTYSCAACDANAQCSSNTTDICDITPGDANVGTCTCDNNTVCGATVNGVTTPPYCLKGTGCVACLSTVGCGKGTYCGTNANNVTACVACNDKDHCGSGCSVCTGSAEPACSTGNTPACTCGSDAANCSANNTCTGGVCVHSCTKATEATDCKTAAQGSVCVTSSGAADGGTADGGISEYCGCVDTATDCKSIANTTCISGVCTCGGTLCLDGQKCADGVCTN